MIDSNYLTASNAKSVRGMKKENTDEFYKVLLRDFETNLKILENKKLSSPRAVKANVKEMAEELLSNGITKEIPINIENCNGEESCIDKELETLSEELLIDENESKIIVEEETKALKELLLGKTFYNVDYSQNSDYLDKMEFSSDGGSIKNTTLIGSNIGSVTTIPMNIEDGKLVTGDDASNVTSLLFSIP